MDREHSRMQLLNSGTNCHHQKCRNLNIFNRFVKNHICSINIILIHNNVVLLFCLLQVLSTSHLPVTYCNVCVIDFLFSAFWCHEMECGLQEFEILYCRVVYKIILNKLQYKQGNILPNGSERNGHGAPPRNLPLDFFPKHVGYKDRKCRQNHILVKLFSYIRIKPS